MHGLATNTDLSWLLGATVEAIHTYSHQAQLKLSRGIEVSIEGVWQINGAAPNDTTTKALLGQTITDVAIPHQKELVLTLTHGYQLTLLDSNETFESFSFSGPNDQMIIV